MNSPQDKQKQKKKVATVSKSITEIVQEEVKNLPEETDESQAILELEIARLQRDKLQIEVDGMREGIADQQADRALRKRYADYAFRFLLGFSVFCGVVLVAQGIPNFPFKLDESIVITLIGSTAVSVVGLVGWVARGLFKAPDG